MKIRLSYLTVAMLAGFLLAGTQLVTACPFCETMRQTLTEHVDAADAAVIAQRLVDSSGGRPAAGSDKMFRIARVLSGKDNVGSQRKIEALYFGDASGEQKFLILGNKVPELMWASPVPLSDEAFQYLSQQLEFPRDSHERVSLALKHLTSEEKILRQDAYDEFARAPYDHLHEIKDELNATELLAQIKDEKTPWERRRLFLTLLGVCGDEEHVAEIEVMLESHTKTRQSALDALAACYMTLRGAESLPLLEEKFLMSEEAEQMVRASAVISALRFHGERDKEVSRQAIAQVLSRTMARPQLAGKVLVDLTRWKEWSIVDDVAKLYNTAQGEAEWVKAPAFRYLEACPLPAAKQHVDAIMAADPDARIRARPYFPIQTTPASRQATPAPSSVPTTKVAANVAVAENGKSSEGSAETADMEASDGRTIDLVEDADRSARRVAWLAIYPIAGACLLVLIFWRWNKGRSAGDNVADSGE